MQRYESLNIINEFDKNITLENYDKDFNLYIELFTRKLKKSSINIKLLHTQLLHEENKDKFKTITPLRYINWLLQV